MKGIVAGAVVAAVVAIGAEELRIAGIKPETTTKTTATTETTTTTSTATTTSTVPGPTTTTTKTETTPGPTTTETKTETTPGPTTTETKTETTTVTTTVEPLPQEPQAGRILIIDYAKCTGCMECAIACAEKFGPEIAPDVCEDTVNLEFSRIRPMRFQHVDVPQVCSYCHLMPWAEGSNMHPCQAVCPQDAIITVPEGDPEAKSGYYGMGYMKVLRDKCLGLEACGRCLEVCEEQFGGGIFFDPIEHKAQVCSMCSGIPACVDACPENAIEFQSPSYDDGRFHAHRAEDTAEMLYRKLYGWVRDI